MPTFRHLVAIGLALGLAAAAFAQPYPNKPVRVVVPSGAGSGTDTGMRYLAEGIQRAIGQNIVIENRPGAAGNIGVAYASKQPADGYTLVTGGLGINAMNQFLYTVPQMGYDPVKDLEPIVLVAKVPFLFAAGSGFGPANVRDLLAAAKARPDSINVAFTTTSGRMAYELFARTSGAPLFPIAYKATGPAVTDTIAGTVSITVETLGALRPHVASGRLKPIAVTSRRATALLPGVSSVAEQGLPDFEIVGWISLYGPKGMPREAIAFINAEFNRMLQQPETQKRFADFGLEAAGGSPQDLADFEEAERKRWGPLIRAANIKAE